MPSEYPSKSMVFSYAYRPGIWMADVINGNYIRSGEMLEKNYIIPLFGVFLFIPSFLSVFVFVGNDTGIPYTVTFHG